MSRAGVSLGGVLASRARLRFTRQRQNITETLNDVLAYNLLNDVVASKSYIKMIVWICPRLAPANTARVSQSSGLAI